MVTQRASLLFLDLRAVIVKARVPSESIWIGRTVGQSWVGARSHAMAEMMSKWQRSSDRAGHVRTDSLASVARAGAAGRRSCAESDDFPYRVGPSLTHRSASLAGFMHVMQCDANVQNGRRYCLFRLQNRSQGIFPCSPFCKLPNRSAASYCSKREGCPRSVPLTRSAEFASRGSNTSATPGTSPFLSSSLEHATLGTNVSVGHFRSTRPFLNLRCHKRRRLVLIECSTVVRP